jgi:hypothetical protein
MVWLRARRCVTFSPPANLSTETPPENTVDGPDHDLAGAADWLKQQDPEHADYAKNSLARAWLRNGEPEAAKAWADAIRDDSLRANAREWIFSTQKQDWRYLAK